MISANRAPSRSPAPLFYLPWVGRRREFREGLCGQAASGLAENSWGDGFLGMLREVRGTFFWGFGEGEKSQNPMVLVPYG